MKIAYITCPSCGYVHNIAERRSGPAYIPTGCPQENTPRPAPRSAIPHRYSMLEMVNIYKQLVAKWSAVAVRNAIRRELNLPMPLRLPAWVL